MADNTPGENKKYRILIVEDDLPTLESTIIKFEKKGFEVGYALNGKSAWEKVEVGSDFDIILLDLHLPIQDGFWFLGKTIQEKMGHEIPVVVFTNVEMSEWPKKAKKLGVKGYLLKANHSLEEIVEEVVRCLKEGECLFEGGGRKRIE